MPNATSIDIKDILEASTKSIGTFGATTGWGIYISQEPANSPDSVISLYDRGGTDPNPKWLLDFPDLQIRVRGAKNGYQAAYNKCIDIRDEILGLPKTTQGGTDYIGIWQVGDINFIQYDDNNRPILTMNFRLAREPASGDNRSAI